MPKVGMVSLGCPKNLVDSEVMLGILARQGYEVTARPEEADVIIVNTCAFIGPAKQESINTILEMGEYKRRGRARRLVVAGCLVERYREDIVREIPEVDCVIGTQEVERVLAAVAPELGTEAAAPTTPRAPYLYQESTPRLRSTPRYSAYVKIAEGCDHPCSFCVIPQMRGSFRSRRFASVVREAEELARQGVREVTLVGQDTTSYGEDLGMREGLAALLRELGGFREFVWVRFLYCYPNRVTEALLRAVAESPRVAKYLDIPFQHASPKVLRRMRRGGSGAGFLRLIERMRTAIPGVTVRTSLLTGFPGETGDDFRALLDFVKEAEFDHLGVFLYSNEETSGSCHLPEQVEARTAASRRRRLMEVQRGISRRKLRRLLGERLAVVVEGRAEETPLLLRARSERHAPGIDGCVLINDCVGAAPEAGQFRWATVTEAGDYDLVARLEPHFFTPGEPPAWSAPFAASARGDTAIASGRFAASDAS